MAGISGLVEEVVEAIAGNRMASIHVYPTCWNPERSTIAHVSIAMKDGRSFFVPVCARDGVGKKGLDDILRSMEGMDFVLAWDAKDVIRVLEKDIGRKLDGIHWWDVQIDTWMCDTETKRPEFRRTVREKLPCQETNDSVGSFLDIGGNSLLGLGKDDIGRMCVLDAENLFRLEGEARRFLNPLGISSGIDQSVVYPLSQMEGEGIGIDSSVVERIRASSLDAIKRYMKELFDLTGRRIDYTNNTVVRRLLEWSGGDFDRDDDGSISVNIASIAKAVASGRFKSKHWEMIVECILHLRKADLFLNGALKGFRKRFDGMNVGRFCYSLCNVPTGRISYVRTENDFFSDLNIQSVVKPPLTEWTARKATQEEIDGRMDVDGWMFVRGEERSGFKVSGRSPELNVRQCFIPDDDSLWVTVDMDSEELRIISNLYGERHWIDAFLSGKDVHSENARKLFGTATKENRKLIKELTYGLNYGMSSRMFIERHPELGADFCNKFISDFKASVPSITEGQRNECESARRSGMCRSGISRKRNLRKLLSTGNGLDFGQAMRCALNSPVQGIAGDVLRIQLKRIWDEIIENDEFSGVRFMMTIHDEISFSVPRRILQKALKKIVGCMTYRHDGWPVPLTCTVEVGPNWGETFPFALDAESGRYVPVAVSV